MSVMPDQEDLDELDRELARAEEAAGLPQIATMRAELRAGMLAHPGCVLEDVTGELTYVEVQKDRGLVRVSNDESDTEIEVDKHVAEALARSVGERVRLRRSIEILP